MRTFKKNQILSFIVLFFSFILSSCCPGPWPWCDGTLEPPEPSFGFKEVWVNNSTASVGDVIEFRWQYHREDELKNQWIEKISLTLNGKMWRLMQGCSPDNPNDPCMDKNVRASNFIFPGPLTVVIGAESQDGEIIRAAFDVILPESAYLKAKITAVPDLIDNVPNLAYPRIGLSSQGTKTISFPVFWGVYDDVFNNSSRQVDGRINQFCDNIDLQGILSENHPFLGRSYRDDPSNRFGFTQGCAFPLLESDYLDSPDAIDLSENISFSDLGYRYADAMIIAAKLMYQGKVIKTTDGKGRVFEVQTGDMTFEPVFMQIDLRSQNDGLLHVVDMHIGNINQGFVASAYHGVSSYRYLANGGYSVSYNWPNGSPRQGVYAVGKLDGGYVKDSKLGFNANGLVRHVLINEVFWNEVPFYSDFEIGGLRRCPTHAINATSNEWCIY